MHSALPQLPDTQAEFDLIADLAGRFLDSNPRRIKRLLNTYRFVKILASLRTPEQLGGWSVQEAAWQQTMLAWLVFTMKWPTFMARAIDQARLPDTQDDPQPEFLRDWTPPPYNQNDRPDPQDLITYLDLSMHQLTLFSDLAGNFLIENPTTPPVAQAESNRPDQAPDDPQSAKK